VNFAREAEVPEVVRAALARILGAPVDHVRVIEHSLWARLHGRAVATTRRNRIYLRGSAQDFFGNSSLLLHEYCHVILQWQPGRLTVRGYLLECLRRGYWNNRFEIEARDFAARHVATLHAQIAGSAEQGLAAVQPAGDEHQHRAHRESCDH
jgi:Domain of unknown function (DUF4157)